MVAVSNATDYTKQILEDLVSKLVKTGHKQLSVNVLFKMGTSMEIV